VIEAPVLANHDDNVLDRGGCLEGSRRDLLIGGIGLDREQACAEQACTSCRDGAAAPPRSPADDIR